MLDLHNNIKLSSAMDPITGTDNTALVGKILDTNGYETLEIAIQSGTLADADATFALTIAESAASDMSGSNAVAAADLLGTVAAASYTFADDNVVKKIGYRGTKRYVRITITPTNNTGNAPFSAIACQTVARVAPVA